MKIDDAAIHHSLTTKLVSTMSNTELLQQLAQISTATITTLLFKKGVRKVWMRGPRPLKTGTPRIAGPAFTLRFIPVREDLATPAAWSSPRSTRAAVEAMTPGSIVVVDAMGVTDAGIFGDILCQRMVEKNVAGLVTDGVMRDLTGVLQTGLPVWAQGTASPPAVSSMHFVGWQEPVGCGGVAVFADDIVVADDDGAVVIPAALAAEIAAAAPDQDRLEEWIMDEVKQGAALPGLYPPNEENKLRYERYQSAQRPSAKK